MSFASKLGSQQWNPLNLLLIFVWNYAQLNILVFLISDLEPKIISFSYVPHLRHH